MALHSIPNSVAIEPELANNPEADGLVDAITTVARERVALMERLRGALVEGDDASALALARELVGLPRDGGAK